MRERIESVGERFEREFEKVDWKRGRKKVRVKIQHEGKEKKGEKAYHSKVDILET